MKQRYIPFIFFCCAATTSLLEAFDLNRFFQAAFRPNEPRSAKEDLTTLRIRGGAGISREKDDECGTPLYDCDNRYRIGTLVFDGGHTFCHGIFFNATLPFYRFNIQEGSPAKQSCSAVGDLCLTTGWTVNYEECEHLDFIDVTLETGVIAPTATRPLGARGMPFRAVAALGVYDWITFGVAADVVLFFDACNGRLWDLSWYLKADHFARGLSLGFGTTHTNQRQTPIPWNCEILPCWTMDTFHFFISYDAACAEHPWYPEVEFFYNHVLSGRNVIRAPCWGISITSSF